MIRYYGAYWRVKKKKYKKIMGMIYLFQTTLIIYYSKWAPICINCGCEMVLDIIVPPDPPPDNLKFGEKLGDWNYLK